MIFSKYFIELKHRIFLLAFTGFTTFICCYVYKETLLFLLVQSQNVAKSLDLSQEPIRYLIFTNITEVFSTYIQLITFLTTQIITLYFFYHVFFFLTPSFYKTEYRKIKLTLSSMFLVLLFSIISFTYIILPLTWKFFWTFQYIEFINLHFEVKLYEYFHFFLYVYYTSIFYFQVLCFLSLIINNFVTNSQNIRKLRKIVYLLIVLISLLISPPDAVVQSVILINLCLAYEVIFIYSIYCIFK